MTDSYTLVTGDFVRTGGMDAANYHLARHLALGGAGVHLVAHRVAPDLLALPEVRWHRVAKPLGSYLLGGPLLAGAGRRWGRAALARGGRMLANGGNCVSPDTNWVHYVHAGHRPLVTTGAMRRAVGAWAYRRFLRAERRALAAARLVIANSDATRRDLIDRLGVRPDRVHTVYYGTDATYHRPPTVAERTAARAALGWRDERPGVAFVGALGDRRKGFDVLFSAWESLCGSGGWDVRLAVVGAGAELDAWRARAAAAGLAEHVRFVGFTRDVREVIWACDAIVAPARYEAYGLAVHEAVCCGLPAIVHADAGVAERLPEFVALRPERREDAGALAGALRTWRDGREDWAQRAAGASARLREWSWDDMGARIVELMREAA